MFAGISRIPKPKLIMLVFAALVAGAIAFSAAPYAYGSVLYVSFGDATIDDKAYTAGARVDPPARMPGGEEIPRLPEATVTVPSNTYYYEVAYTITGLPAGLYMGSDRVIRGTPSEATSGAVTVNYTATVTTYTGDIDNTVKGPTGLDFITFKVTVNPPVTFSAEAQQFFNSNIIAYSPAGWENATFPEAQGGTGTLTYSLIHNDSGQSLADHVSSITFDASTRTIGGTVGSGERYAVTFIAEDENGAAAQGYTEVRHGLGIGGL